MMRITFWVFAALYTAGGLAAQSPPVAPPATPAGPAAPVNPARVRQVGADVGTLAADAWQGRKVCSPGGDSARAWLTAWLRRLRIAPAFDGAGYDQRWTLGSTTATRQAGVAGCAATNLVGVLRGAGPLATQTVIVGAHYDHLGTGPFASRTPQDSGRPHNGADDNASGTAAVLEIARLLVEERRSGRVRNARTVVFVLFDAEEEGALGSVWFAGNPAPQPLDSAIAMLNFDMVGRLRNNRLLVLGARSATEWAALLDSVNAGAAFDMRASGDGWGPSDHASFFARKRPVLHFFTDLHEEYHGSRDDAELIAADGIVRIADFAADLTRRLMVRPAMLTFVDAPPPAPPAAAASGRARPSLGTIPDMSDEPGGVRLSGVRSGSAADSAGMRQGDILIGIGEHAIANLQDFQNALMAHEAGQRVEIRWRRGEQIMRATVTLGGRAN